MTAHDFARQLLEGPDLPIAIPKVKEYEDDGEDNMAHPVVIEQDFIDPDGDVYTGILITYQ